MANYIGSKCFACEEKFNSDDDIVVCPECGTPYHRSCYQEKGSCINTELHENGGSWSAVNNKGDTENSDDSQEIKCPRCGTVNPKTGLFCDNCGLPLSISQDYGHDSRQDNATNGDTPPFSANPYTNTITFNAELDIDGNTCGDYANYVGNNRLYFLAQFVKFSKYKSKVSMNLIAFLFPEFYFYHRKMNIIGTLALILVVIFNIPAMIIYVQDSSIVNMLKNVGLYKYLGNNIDIKSAKFETISSIAFYGTIAIRITCGFFANLWYYKKANKAVTNIKASSMDTEEINEQIVKKGGTRPVAVVIAIVVYSLLTAATLYGTYQII